MSYNGKFIVTSDADNFVDLICDTLGEATRECIRLGLEDGFAEVYKLEWCCAYDVEVTELDENGDPI